jgi:hypothetical protein
MPQTRRAPRGANTVPPAGYDIIRCQGRHYPVRLHLEDRCHAGASAFHRPDGSVVSFARRLPAVLYLYQHVVPSGTTEGKASHASYA